MINVTQSFLPDKEVFLTYIDQIWKTKWLTNHGPLSKELEEKLANYLGVKHLLLINNGTTALQIAIHTLGEPGEVIVTPFTYVATVSSIVWERFSPVFVDIDPNTLTIDASKIEAAITPKTRAIMGVHVYGNPCDVEKIEEIAHKHNIKVIYDAAHAFGVKYKNKPIAMYGDMSVFSFHATKIFHTIEGGAIATNDGQLVKKIKYFRNFGHVSPISFGDVGINGKLNEFSAAMGLSVLQFYPMILNKRKQICNLYDMLLSRISYISIPLKTPYTTCNYSYYPIVFDSESRLLSAINLLDKEEIFARRYFYPSLNTLPYVEEIQMQVSEDIAPRTLCLPLYDSLDENSVKRISSLLGKLF
jgi:dTDP-4-amino-4,6-dideoxygalactose transaminase